MNEVMSEPETLEAAELADLELAAELAWLALMSEPEEDNDDWFVLFEDHVLFPDDDVDDPYSELGGSD